MISALPMTEPLEAPMEAQTRTSKLTKRICMDQLKAEGVSQAYIYFVIDP